ncbi:MAG: hypothetical protein HPY51_04170 [Candidatus Omnitrophica bacterium]|nr:hypothetical protein [Candidatus Omnitrophota bacterium]
MARWLRENPADDEQSWGAGTPAGGDRAQGDAKQPPRSGRGDPSGVDDHPPRLAPPEVSGHRCAGGKPANPLPGWQTATLPRKIHYGEVINYKYKKTNYTIISFDFSHNIPEYMAFPKMNNDDLPGRQVFIEPSPSALVAGSFIKTCRCIKIHMLSIAFLSTTGSPLLRPSKISRHALYYKKTSWENVSA